MSTGLAFCVLIAGVVVILYTTLIARTSSPATTTSSPSPSPSPSMDPEPAWILHAYFGLGCGMVLLAVLIFFGDNLYSYVPIVILGLASAAGIPFVVFKRMPYLTDNKQKVWNGLMCIPAFVSLVALVYGVFRAKEVIAPSSPSSPSSSPFSPFSLSSSLVKSNDKIASEDNAFILEQQTWLRKAHDNVLKTMTNDMNLYGLDADTVFLSPMDTTTRLRILLEKLQEKNKPVVQIDTIFADPKKEILGQGVHGQVWIVGDQVSKYNRTNSVRQQPYIDFVNTLHELLIMMFVFPDMIERVIFCPRNRDIINQINRCGDKQDTESPSLNLPNLLTNEEEFKAFHRNLEIGELVIIPVMRKVSGKTLAKVLEEEMKIGKLDNVQRVWKHCRQLMDQLAQLPNFVHNDLHPDNVIVSDRDKVQFLDFGDSTALVEWQNKKILLFNYYTLAHGADVLRILWDISAIMWKHGANKQVEYFWTNVAVPLFGRHIDQVYQQKIHDKYVLWMETLFTSRAENELPFDDKFYLSTEVIQKCITNLLDKYPN
jgi:hypothetical protein